MEPPKQLKLNDLWRMCCEYDANNPESSMILLSDRNPYKYLVASSLSQLYRELLALSETGYPYFELNNKGIN